MYYSTVQRWNNRKDRSLHGGGPFFILEKQMEDYHFFYQNNLEDMLYKHIQANSEDEAWALLRKNEEDNIQVRVLIKGPVDLDILYQE